MTVPLVVPMAPVQGGLVIPSMSRRLEQPSLPARLGGQKYPKRCCAENSFDNVRVMRGFMTVRCRVCERKIRAPVQQVKSWKCEAFWTDKVCPNGDACPFLHLHFRKQGLKERLDKHGPRVLNPVIRAQAGPNRDANVQSLLDECLDIAGVPRTVPPSCPHRQRQRPPCLVPVPSSKDVRRQLSASSGCSGVPILPPPLSPGSPMSPASTVFTPHTTAYYRRLCYDEDAADALARKVATPVESDDEEGPEERFDRTIGELKQTLASADSFCVSEHDEEEEEEEEMHEEEEEEENPLDKTYPVVPLQLQTRRGSCPPLPPSSREDDAVVATSRSRRFSCDVASVHSSRRRCSVSSCPSQLDDHANSFSFHRTRSGYLTDEAGISEEAVSPMHSPRCCPQKSASMRSTLSGLTAATFCHDPYAVSMPSN